MSQGPIPTFDIGEYTHAESAASRAAFVKKLGDAYREWGFAGIRNHGISAETIDAAYDVFKAFFAVSAPASSAKRMRNEPVLPVWVK